MNKFLAVLFIFSSLTALGEPQVGSCESMIKDIDLITHSDLSAINLADSNNILVDIHKRYYTDYGYIKGFIEGVADMNSNLRPYLEKLDAWEFYQDVIIICRDEEFKSEYVYNVLIALLKEKIRMMPEIQSEKEEKLEMNSENSSRVTF